MRPYIAIIRDSFRAAFASRVLYVLLGVITVLLILVSPMHIRETLDWQLKFGEQVKRPEFVVRRLMQNKDDAKRPYINRIWSQLSEKTRSNVIKIHERNSKSKDDKKAHAQEEVIFEYLAMISDLNKIIKQRDFYQPEEWEGRSLGDEAQGLIDEGPATLSDEQSRRLNRLLIAKAFPGAIETGAPSAISFYYGPFTRDWATLSLTRQQVKSWLSTVLPSIFDKFILSIGLFIAILVTANIIPETFEPGSLNLLLSKPISRWALYVAKFIGGCTLVAICSFYLFVGTWLWLGLGLGVWDRAFLWSIPLYILVFAIYFSVSAFIGMRYRSAIMAIVVTGLFWAFCYGVGTVYGFMNTRMENSNLYGMTLVKENVVALDGIGNLVVWEAGSKTWEQQYQMDLDFETQTAVSMLAWLEKLPQEKFRLPPLFDYEKNLVYAGWFSLSDPLGVDRQDFVYADADTLAFKKHGQFPGNAMAMFNGKNGLLVVTRSGTMWQLDTSQLVGNESKEPTNSTARNSFRSVGPDKSVSVNSTSSVAMNKTNREIAICSRRDGKQQVFVYRMEDGKYQRHRSAVLDTGSDVRLNCLVEYQGDLIVVVAGNGRVIVLDAKSLNEKQDYLPESRVGIESICGSPDGRWFTMLYKNKTVWLLDSQNNTPPRKPALRGQGSISSVGFDDANQLWAADRNDRVTQYDLETLDTSTSVSPGGGFIQKFYRYAVKPFYRVCPKPGEFYKVVTHLSNTSDTLRGNHVDVDLTEVPYQTSPLSPLWSGLAFMFAMLLIGCLVFHFKDY